MTTFMFFLSFFPFLKKKRYFLSGANVIKLFTTVNYRRKKLRTLQDQPKEQQGTICTLYCRHNRETVF